MTKFNVSRFTRSVGCFAAVTAVLLSASATQAGSHYGVLQSNRFQPSSAIRPIGHTRPPTAYRPAGVSSANHPNPMTAPPQASPRHFGTDGLSQGRWEGLHGEGCLGKPRLPQSVNEQLRPKPLKIDEWPDERAIRLLLHTSSTHRLVPNRIPMR